MFIIKNILEIIQAIIEVVGGSGIVIIIMSLLNKGNVEISSNKKVFYIVALGSLMSIILNVLLQLCK